MVLSSLRDGEVFVWPVQMSPALAGDMFGLSSIRCHIWQLMTFHLSPPMETDMDTVVTPISNALYVHPQLGVQSQPLNPLYITSLTSLPSFVII